jgi:hypothetical protein
VSITLPPERQHARLIAKRDRVPIETFLPSKAPTFALPNFDVPVPPYDPSKPAFSQPAVPSLPLPKRKGAKQSSAIWENPSLSGD